jgi:putative metallohydrolase (TIGR04338 family)
MVRDTQRSKLYKAEDAVFLAHRPNTRPPSPDFRSVDECQKFVNKVMRSKLWKELAPDDFWTYATVGWPWITVTDGRGRSRAAAVVSHYEIALPRWSRNRWTILHELAHFAVDLETQAPHGPQFASAYVRLVERFIGPVEAFCLERSFVDHNVKRF